MAKPKSIEIVSVKVTRKYIRTKWIQGDDTHDVKWNDNPLPALQTSFDALGKLVPEMCGLPKDYNDTNFKVVSFDIGAKGGAQTIAISCSKKLDTADKQFEFTTPERLFSQPTEPGTVVSAPLTDKQAELVADVIEEAKRYVRNGPNDRAQGQLPGVSEGEDDDGDGDARDASQPSLGLGETATGKPVKKKGAK